MSYETAILWSIIRSLLVGAICVSLARELTTWRDQSRQPSSNPSHRLLSHRVTTVLLMVPFFMPGLVVGYAYRNASLSLVQTPVWNEVLYLAIVVAQLLPVAVVALEWLPPASLGPSAKFCLQMIGPRQRSFRERIREALAGELPRLWTTGTITALLCFQEVEVATLMQARGWAEWIFTKQAGGVELVQVWRWLVLPISYGLSLTLPVLFYWTFRQTSPATANAAPLVAFRSAKERFLTAIIASLIIALSWLLTVIWPVASLTVGAIRGAGVLQLRSAIWRETGDALILAVTVTVLLVGIGWLARKCGKIWGGWNGSLPGRGQLPMLAVAGACLIPGLLGSLILGLTIFEICQQMGLQPSYSPVPLVSAMVLLLLPRAWVMQALWQRSVHQPAIFMAEHLMCFQPVSRSWRALILWRMRDAGRFWLLALLFWWSYLELTLPSLLRPAGMAPAPMRLYNFLHYGHIPGLAAMLVLVLAVPLVLFGLGHAWLAGHPPGASSSR